LLHLKTRTVAETAAINGGLPSLVLPSLPANPNWPQILSYTASVGMIGLIETVMTHEVWTFSLADK
jgi:hypothetical protein